MPDQYEIAPVIPFDQCGTGPDWYVFDGLVPIFERVYVTGDASVLDESPVGS